MKQLTIRVDDKKYASLLEYLKSIDGEIIMEESPKKSRKESSTEAKLTPSQKKTWAIIKEGFEELKLIEQRKKQARPIEELFRELKEEGLYP